VTTSLSRRWPATALAAGLLTVLASGCVVPGGGYDAGYGVDYYEPYGIDVGGWGPGYHVAPFHDRDHRPAAKDEHGSPPAYRGAPPSRAIPSLPSGSRSGGGRGGGGGGGRGGGGHGGGGGGAGHH
jgi:hypothetical protein